MRTFLAVFGFVLCAGLLPADQTPAPPDVSGWKRLQATRLDMRLDDERLLILGFSALYEDPADASAHVQVLYQHQPVVVFARETATDDLYTTRDLSNFNRHREETVLNEVRKSAVPFRYISQRVTEGIISGPVQAWLLCQDGTWAHAAEISEDTLFRTVLTEPDFRHRTRLTPVGLVFHLGETVHIVRLNQASLPTYKAAQKETETNRAK